MNMHRSRLSSAIIVGLYAITAAGAVFAQEANEADEWRIEEVIVTAQKREQSLQDVPITVNAFTSGFLDKVAAEDMEDLAEFTPGLEASGKTQPNYKIRGIQTSDFGVGTDPSVAVYVDGVYSTRSGAALVPFSDVARVEVLKGPQGTLFGRNSAAGAVSIITNQPDTQVKEGFFNIRAGRHGKRRVEAMYNLPASDNVAFRFNAQVNRRDGYEDDAFTGEDYGREANETGRFQALWEPTENTSINFTYEFDRTDQDEEKPQIGFGNGNVWYPLGTRTVGDIFPHGQVLPLIFSQVGIPIGADAPVETLLGLPIGQVYGGLAQFLGYNPTNAGTQWDFIRDPLAVGGSDPFGPVASDIGNGYERRNLDGVSLRVNHDFGDVQMTSVTSWKEFDTQNLQDEDGTAQADFYFDTENFEINDQFYQEIRFNGQNDNFSWVAGASYYKENAIQRSNAMGTTDSIDTVLYNVGATPGVLAQGLDLSDGINNPCENLYFDSWSQYIQFTDLPVACFDPSLAPVLGGYGFNPFSSIEDLLNAFGTSWYGRSWREDMAGEGRTRSWGIFVDGTWAVNDRLNIQAGVRYTKDKKSWAWINGNRTISGYDELSIPLFGNLADIHKQFLATVLGGSGDLVFSIPGEPTVEGLVGERSDSWDYISPRITLDYAINDDVMVYGSYTIGHKSGGHNSLQLLAVYDNEEVDNIEVGFKSQFADDRVRLNASFWDYTYNDLQSQSLENISESGIPQYVVVTSDVEGQGIDLDMLFAASDRFTVSLLAAMQDVTYGTGVVRSGEDVSGQPTGEPKLRASLGLDYDIDLSSGGLLSLHLDHNYTSKRRENDQCRRNNSCGISTWGGVSWNTGESRSTTNARATWHSADRGYSVSAFIKNLTKEEWASGAGGLLRDTMYAPSGGLNEPWTWGIDLGWKF